MPDFSSLLRQPAGQAKKPEALPVGTYQGLIKSFEVADNNKNKTPYVRVQLTLQGWPEDVEALPEVDLSKRTLRRDYYMTPDALWRLDKLLTSCGIEVEGQTYEETIPKLVNQSVFVSVTQRTMTGGDEAEVVNDVRDVTGAA